MLRGSSESFAIDALGGGLTLPYSAVAVTAARAQVP